MAKTFVQVQLPEGHNGHGCDIWEVSENEKMLGWYFVPKGVTGAEYDNARNSAIIKLQALNFTELEIQALLGRQLF
jgi:hypothetical protein